VEALLSMDMATVDEYLQTSKLKLSTTKTVSAVFHLNNKEVKRDLPFCSKQTPWSNIGQVAHVSQHLESHRKRLTSRVALLRQLAGSGWHAGETTLQMLALVHSPAEYCTPVWCHSA